MPPHRPSWGPPPGAAYPPGGSAMPPPGYFPPSHVHQGGALPPQWGAHHPFAMPPPQQPRPVSSKPITGTDWLEVTNDNGTKFWHNTKTNQGVWQKPAEVKFAARAPPPLNAAKLKMLERARASGAVIAPEYKAAGKGDKGLLLLEGGANAGLKAGGKGGKASGNRSVIATQEQLTKTEEENAEEEEEEEEEEFDVKFTEDDIDGGGEQEFKKSNNKSTAPLPPPTGPPPPSTDTIRANKEKDIAVENAFRALLKENFVHGFSRYEKELPKLQKDPRFGALLPAERRRTVFEDYCSKVGMDSSKIEELPAKKEKKQIASSTSAADGGGTEGVVKKAAEDAFRALLQERVVRPDVRWYRIKDDLKKDSRFDTSSILSEERKQDIFRSHIDSLYKVEEARERAARRTHHAQHAGEERQRYAQAAVAEQNFKVLLGEAVRGDQSADWDSTWQRLHRDPQGRATDPMLDVHIAKRMFMDHVAQLKAAQGDDLSEKVEEGAKKAGEAGEGGETKGMDPAYARAYLEGRDSKRHKRDE
jgi:transcription elongation regulator 1